MERKKKRPKGRDVFKEERLRFSTDGELGDDRKDERSRAGRPPAEKERS